MAQVRLRISRWLPASPPVRRSTWCSAWYYLAVLPADRLTGIRVTSKGQVTIPLAVRRKLGIEPGSEVEFELDEHGARLVRNKTTRGKAIARRMRGRATVARSTDEIMALTRGNA
ncbi:AbrB/MazE/SpoVT family DNA-binding domain-containing protein [Mycobacterium pseudokansasii]|nr:AbrB/MazE/SpoVT family DNA-binding domain-containing protein [Mycobacterium pseudokansasii]